MKLPKDMVKLTKDQFVTKYMNHQEEKEITFAFVSRIYQEWAETGTKKSAKKTYRW